MSKPDWKTKPHERKRMTLQQENQALKERIQMMLEDNDQTIRALNHYKEQANLNLRDADRYRVLKNKDVMVLDGEPKYLKGKDLDEYCDAEDQRLWGVSLAGMTNRGRGVTAQMMRAVIDELQEERNGNDTGSKSKEADQKDSGHYTDILRYAYWNRLRK